MAQFPSIETILDQTNFSTFHEEIEQMKEKKQIQIKNEEYKKYTNYQSIKLSIINRIITKVRVSYNKNKNNTTAELCTVLLLFLKIVIYSIYHNNLNK